MQVSIKKLPSGRIVKAFHVKKSGKVKPSFAKEEELATLKHRFKGWSRLDLLLLKNNKQDGSKVRFLSETVDTLDF